ncbi:MAG: glycosyltransferase family 4 protein [Candidatus Pacebacteria bacterium]|nr:glycosyltransferase family 4 protein [Candidatus Paceibacterota bacterium]
MKVLSIGPDKDLLTPGSVSFERHRRYAEHVEELHAVIFARRSYGTERVAIAQNAWSYPTGSTSTLGLFRDAYRIGRRLLREPGTWVISAQDPFESGLVGYVLSRVTGAPLLLQEHGDFFSTPYWRNEFFLNRVRFYVGMWLLRRAAHVRVVSMRIAETLSALKVPKERMSVVPVFTEVSSTDSVSALAQYRPKNGLVVLTMARFVPQKNLSLLIRAVGHVQRQGGLIHLVIVGKGREQKRLEQTVEKYAKNAVTFLGWTDDPSSLLASADIYALSSDYEGWGRVCIEALAAGTPLLMTDVGCAGEVVRNNENGLVVPVRDEQAFADALMRLATDASLRERLARAGRDTVRRMGTREDSVAAYRKSLECCIVLPHENAKSGKKAKGYTS